MASNLGRRDAGTYFENVFAIAIWSTSSAVPQRVEIHAQLEKGLPADVLHQLQTLEMFKDQGLLAKVLGMTELALQRHIGRSEPLSPAQSSCCAWRFARVLSQAEAVFGERQLAERWLVSPVLGLNGHVPVDLLTTPVGAEMVRELPARIDYGVYA